MTSITSSQIKCEDCEDDALFNGDPGDLDLCLGATHVYKGRHLCDVCYAEAELKGMPFQIVERRGAYTLIYQPARGYRWNTNTDDGERSKRMYWDPRRRLWVRKGAHAWSTSREEASRNLS